MEQRYAIAFMLRKEMSPKEIILELEDVYGKEALKKTAVYYWIGQIRMGRNDLSNEPSPGRPIDISIDQFIIKQLELDPFSTARMIARKAGVAVNTIITHLTKSLNMKYVHLQWIPHALNSDQKKKG